jgi:signal transduction histidine kinase
MEGLSGLRDFIWSIEEDAHALGDLAVHLRERIINPLEQEGITTEFETDIRDEKILLAPMVRLNIIRIVQEVIANVVKHASAHHVRISLTERDHRLEISIRDDGRGFDPGEKRRAGYGLRNIRKRSEEMGGECTLISKSGSGTEIKVSLDLSGEKARVQDLDPS